MHYSCNVCVTNIFFKDYCVRRDVSIFLERESLDRRKLKLTRKETTTRQCDTRNVCRRDLKYMAVKHAQVALVACNYQVSLRL